MRLLLLALLFSAGIGMLGAQGHLPERDSSQIKEATILKQRAHQLRTSGEPDSALLVFRQAFALFEQAEDPLGMADCERNIGLSLKGELRYTAAAAAYRRAIVLFETIPEQHPAVFAAEKESIVQQLSWAYLNLAEVYSYLDDQQQVRIYLSRSQDLLERYQGDYPLLAREARENQARFLDMMGAHDESAAVYRSILAGIPPGTEATYENRLICKIAQVYGREAERYGEAIPYWLQAIDHYYRYPVSDPSYLVAVYRELARCHINLGQLDEAQDALDEAWRLQSASNNALQAAILYFNEARLLHARGQHREALAAIDKGTSAFSFPPSSSLANIEVLRSMVYFHLYGETDDLGDLAASEEWARRSLATLENYEDRTFQQRSYGRFYRKPTEWLLHCLYARYEESPEEALLEEIFQLMEQSRARQLRLGRNWEEQLLSSRFPPELIERKEGLERDRRRLLAERYQLERQAEPGERFFVLSDSLVFLEEAMTELRLEMEAIYPLGQSDTDWPACRQALPNAAGAVLYFAGDSTIFSLAFSRMEVVPTQTRMTAEQRTLLAKLPRMVRRSDSPADSLGRLLIAGYQAFLEPMLKHLPASITQLYLVPDGRLTQLPWAALCTTAAGGADFRSWPFLIRQYRLAFLPFAGDLLENNRQQNRLLTRVGCFAPQYSLPEPTDEAPQLAQLMRSEFWPLPGAQKEIEALEELYGRQAHLFTDDLTKDDFADRLPDYSVAHLAMHALANWQDPTQSHLLFPPDVPLTALELLGLDLKTELMILSACYSGEGPWRAGEGVVSLAYVLQQAGVRSVLSNAWAVADQFSGELMLQFHRNLREGHALDAALQEAQLNYLKGAQPVQSAHPFYWAGFQLQGDTAAFKKDNTATYWGLGIGLLVGLALAYWRKSSRSAAA